MLVSLQSDDVIVNPSYSKHLKGIESLEQNQTFEPQYLKNSML